MTTLADRTLELHLRGRTRYGVGSIATLPDLVRESGGVRVLVVTDPGVVRSGVAATVVEVLDAAGLGVTVFDDIEPNPGTATVARGSAALLALGLEGTVVVAVGGGSSMDSAKVISLHGMNGGDVLGLGYPRDALAPGR